MRESEPDLGAVMAVLRVAAGWTVDDLAKASRLRSSTIADYEQGRIIPGLNTLTRVFKVLGYPFSALDVARTCVALMRTLQKHPAAVKRAVAARRSRRRRSLPRPSVLRN